MKKATYGLFLWIFLISNLFAEEIYRLERFKKSSKISSRSIMVNGEFLKQSYDLNGHLALETYTKGSLVSSSCFTSDGKRVDSLDGDSEKYFSCLQDFSDLVTKENGIIEEKSRQLKDQNDLTFQNKGKGLNK